MALSLSPTDMAQVYAGLRHTDLVIPWMDALDHPTLPLIGYSLLNSLILLVNFRDSNVDWWANQKQSKMGHFLTELSKELVTCHMKSRLKSIPTLPTYMAEAMGRCRVTKTAEILLQERSEQGQQKRKGCQLCPRNKDCKATDCCWKCSTPVWNSYSQKQVVCVSCTQCGQFYGHRTCWMFSDRPPGVETHKHVWIPDWLSAKMLLKRKKIHVKAEMTLFFTRKYIIHTQNETWEKCLCRKKVIDFNWGPFWPHLWKSVVIGRLHIQGLNQ